VLYIGFGLNYYKLRSPSPK